MQRQLQKAGEKVYASANFTQLSPKAGLGLGTILQAMIEKDPKEFAVLLRHTKKLLFFGRNYLKHYISRNVSKFAALFPLK